MLREYMDSIHHPNTTLRVHFCLYLLKNFRYFVELDHFEFILELFLLIIPLCMWVFTISFAKLSIFDYFGYKFFTFTFHQFDIQITFISPHELFVLLDLSQFMGQI